MRLSKYLDQDASTQWIFTLFAILTVLHMYSNYRAVRALALRSLNRTRTVMLFDAFMSTKMKDKTNTGNDTVASHHHDHGGSVMSPQQVAALDPIVTWRPWRWLMMKCGYVSDVSSHQ